MYLEHIDSPADVKKLHGSELESLCAELRSALIEELSVRGGHVGPNLGMVEATTALHYVFDSPKDKIVYDVSHQSYAHKMLTGRKAAFTDSAKYGSVTGFSNPKESEHDFFTIGHTSTSVSLASGLAKARDLKNERYNVIAVIGDGSLSGGEAFEGLDYAAENGTNLIVVVNDNEMSIAENHGGLYANLRLLRDTNGAAACNFFKAMGFEYTYVRDGNDVHTLIGAFRAVKDCTRPVVVHIHTVKGKGFAPAEADKETWHYGAPFDKNTGMPKRIAQANGSAVREKDYAALTAEYLLAEMKKDPTVAAITSGTPTVIGFTEEKRRAAGKQFIDVGIAEEHAVALAAGIAKNGGKAVYGVYGTFIQRAYDQLSQDLCIDRNPATVLVFWASVWGMNDVTHLGLFDIALMGSIPNLVYLAPVSEEEYFAMLRWSMRQTEHPVAIRVPAGPVVSTGIEDTTDYSVLNAYQVTRAGETVAILALGSMYGTGEKTAELLAQRGIHATLINPKFITGLDTALLESLKKSTP